MQLPASCALTTGDVREYLMHILIRQQQSSDMFLHEKKPITMSFFFPSSHENGNLTWCNMYVHLHKNV